MQLEDLKDKAFYLATVYTKHPDGIYVAFLDACEITAKLLKRGLKVFSPIVHTHPVAIHGDIEPLDHEFWLNVDSMMMDKMDALMVAKMTNWQDSYGIGCEIKTFRQAGKPIYFLDPLTLYVAQ